MSRIGTMDAAGGFHHSTFGVKGNDNVIEITDAHFRWTQIQIPEGDFHARLAVDLQRLI
jgi:hypothetical protein